MTIKNLYTGISIFLLTGTLLFSCSPTRKLAPNETLYTGSKVKIDSGTAANRKAAAAFKSELEELPRPKPNASILGFRYKLFFYNLAGTPTGKGLRHFIKTKLGEPPVLAGQVNFNKNREVIQNRLENKGFFGSTVSFDTITKHKKTAATYHVHALPRYTIRSIKWPVDSTELGKALGRVTRRSRVKVGDYYDLDVIKEERLRIDTRLKNQGFYYYNEDFLLFNVDSTVGENKADMVVEVKQETPEEAKGIYRINDVVVYADYSINTDTAANPQGTITQEGYKIADPEHKYNPKIFSRTLVFDTGSMYRRNDHNLSLSRLVDLGVFRFVKVRFEPSDTTASNDLNAFYYLTPSKGKSVQAQVGALTKSNNSTGSDISVTWRNRNMFKGAELLTVSAFVGFEKQISGNWGNVNTTRYGVDVNLFIPRILAPFHFPTNSSFIPKTKVNLGYELFHRNTQYKLNSFRGSFGYVWKESIPKEHTLNVLNINYVQPLNITDSFQKAIGQNITLARSIEQQFIIGSSYNYNYNSQAQPNRRKSNLYFNGNIDLSGNLLGLITGADAKNGDRKTILGSPFSQYVRLEADGRHYFRFNPRSGNDNMIASRIIAGVGYAWGNSKTMPFIKQFFVGGTNSIRAWRARSLGPGRYYGGDRDTADFLPDQPGDVKIEANTELRFKIISIMRGAVFVDAGNIWTYNEDTTRRPGAQFNKGFLNDFAVGAGFGLRFDIRLLVLRLDLAFPIRKPYLPGGPAWVLDEIALGSKDWRRKNLILNLAIGYPF